MYIALQSVLGDPRPPFAPWNKNAHWNDERLYGKFKRIPQEARNTHRSGAAIPDVVLFSTTGNWDSLYLTMKDYLQHMSSGVEHLLSSYKNSVLFIFIVDFGFGGRQPSKSNYLKNAGRVSSLICHMHIHKHF